ncbi:hypothetical protein FUA24_11480 [Seonamhaeicola marinus]|uniref:Uncharacterized protein n=1 Tax=Seonamhaeicola marinus TaxID=1912246 RepID=A0A5D0HUL2_9FLAO|nr:hypothetical protein FUA24_11480 [Seonamhaeicola marinus]
MFILCFSVLSLQSQTLKISEVRALYKDAAQDKSKVASFYEMLSKVDKKDGISLNAYKGASIALKSRYAKTIKAKKEGFIEGVTILEAIITEHPNTVEPRFIRLTIQQNSPKLLKYKSNITEDKSFLLKQYLKIKSKSLQFIIKDYILNANTFSEEEKALILKS